MNKEDRARLNKLEWNVKHGAMGEVTRSLLLLSIQEWKESSK